MSPDSAGIYRPSGDQLGENSPFEPGNTVIWWVIKSRIRIDDAGSPGFPPKTILFPSGDQCGSI